MTTRFKIVFFVLWICGLLITLISLGIAGFFHQTYINHKHDLYIQQEIKKAKKLTDQNTWFDDYCTVKKEPISADLCNTIINSTNCINVPKTIPQLPHFPCILYNLTDTVFNCFSNKDCSIISYTTPKNKTISAEYKSVHNIVFMYVYIGIVITLLFLAVKLLNK